MTTTPPREDRYYAAMQRGLEAVIRLADEERQQTWADASATLNHVADVWEEDGSDRCKVRVCREMANAFRTYAEGVGIPSIDNLRAKRREAEARVAELEAAVRAGGDYECCASGSCEVCRPGSGWT